MKNDMKNQLEVGSRKAARKPKKFTVYSLSLQSQFTLGDTKANQNPQPLTRNSFHLPAAAFRAFILVAALSLLVSSCEDVIDVKLSNEDVDLIGVEADITTQDQPTVFVYKTLKVSEDKAYPGISGATVVLTDNAVPANSVTLTENPQKAGLYQVPNDKDYKGVVGREYTLSIQANGVTMTAKEKLARVAPIEKIYVEPSDRGDKRFLGIFVDAHEPAGLGDNYKWDIYINGKLLYDAEYLSIAWDKYVDGNVISKNEIMTDFHDTNKPEDRKLNLNDVIQVKQTSISEFGYNYYYQVINQSSTGGLFSVPPANIKSNFTSSNGKPVLGIFTARDVSVSNQVIITQALEDQLKK
jgi:hypothetical protein